MNINDSTRVSYLVAVFSALHSPTLRCCGHAGRFVFFKARGWPLSDSYDPCGILKNPDGSIREDFAWEIKEEHFIMIISTPEQRKKFSEFGANCVSIHICI